MTRAIAYPLAYLLGFFTGMGGWAVHLIAAAGGMGQ
jgi:hypothetical protein